MTHSRKQTLLGFALLMIGSSAGCSGMINMPNQEQPIAANQTTQTTTNPAPLPSPKLNDLDYVAQIVQQVGPAVVRIDSARTVEQPFGNFGDPFGRPSSPQQRVQRGTGSGFITTPDGRILTNAHVVEGADNVSVVLKDGRRFQGEVVGADPVTDVAVIKIDGNGLQTVKIGNSENLLPGQAVVAIGNPLGLSFTVTQGIVSATGRSASDVGVPAERVDFIQTDAAINPGNSGGPLINSSAEVIGINTAIIQGASGIGFAIPIATAQRIADQLVTKGRVDHPYLGIQMAELSPELRNRINQSDTGVRVNQDQGVVIVGVQQNSPAARAGVRPGDVIVSMSGTAIQTSQQVQKLVEATNVGNVLQMTISRNGQQRNVSVKPEPLPAREPA